MFPKKLQEKITQRQTQNVLRKLGESNDLIDFSSNDYLGFSKNETIFNLAHQYLIDADLKQNGATGSRLLSGNQPLYNEVETMLCKFHHTESALIFNSGYNANLGFFASVPQRGDVVIYDEYIHASIRDGMKLSNAKAYKFKHNNLEDLEQKILRSALNDNCNIYIVTESIFSMDGDSPDLVNMSQICKKHQAHLVVDEAHAVGVFGENGEGLIQQLHLEKAIFARIITFGKALGSHGAAILGSQELKQYLINFARSFIYTTALPPHALATIKSSYNELVLQSENGISQREKLKKNIAFFKAKVHENHLKNHFIESVSPIQSCIIKGNEKVKTISKLLLENGFDVKPILSPTVPESQERLRFCLHSFNSEKDIKNVLNELSKFLK